MNHNSKLVEKRKLEKLSKVSCSGCYNGGAYYSKEENRYVRFGPSHRSAKTKKYYKRYSNRVVRRSNIANYGDYRKICDIWWVLT